MVSARHAHPPTELKRRTARGHTIAKRAMLKRIHATCMPRPMNRSRFVIGPVSATIGKLKRPAEREEPRQRLEPLRRQHQREHPARQQQLAEVVRLEDRADACCPEGDQDPTTTA